jgi:hypothetical protein
VQGIVKLPTLWIDTRPYSKTLNQPKLYQGIMTNISLFSSASVMKIKSFITIIPGCKGKSKHDPGFSRHPFAIK